MSSKLYLISCHTYIGDVHGFTHSKNGAQTLSRQSLEVIARDLSKAFSEEAAENLQQITQFIKLKVRSPMTADQIENVYVFTWLRMAHKTNVRFFNLFLFGYYILKYLTICEANDF